MDALALKVSCWCCQKCIRLRRQKSSCQRSDSQEVFLPPTSNAETNHVANGQPEAKADSICQERDSGFSSTNDENNSHGLDANHVGSALSDEVNNDNLSGRLEFSVESYPFEHLYEVLRDHPQYFNSFLETDNLLMRGTGLLPYDQRYYLGIMAAARHNCSYLVKSLVSCFISCGGNEEWLIGLDRIPKKLRNLCEVNRILAHRPWMLTQHDILKVARDSSVIWSSGELTQALILLAHYHSLASFVCACGITFEGDQKRSSVVSFSSVSEEGSFDSSSDSDVEIDLILERMKLLKAEVNNELSQDELRKRFDKIESQAARLKTKKKPSTNKDILRFIDEPDFTYEDFANRDPSLGILTFDVQDFPWESSGYSYASWLCRDMATLLDEKFQVAQAMTYYKMGHMQNVDTSTFRRAIWNYSHCLFGMFHYDYDYAEIDHMLERSLKWYVKAATCTPETIVLKNYASFMKEFLDSEKVHINIMILEARLQAELLYILRAVSRYLIL